MPIIVFVVAVFITMESIKHGGELYFYDPGFAEYLISFIFLGGIIAAVTGLFKKM